MSFCPNKDIHSVYLDNELPEIYRAEYESHINSCPECRSRLEKLRAAHNLLAADSKNITPDSHYMNQSFERLSVRMSYAKTTRKSTVPSLSALRYTIPAVAAAAVFGLIIPLRMAEAPNMMNSTTAQFVSHTASAPIAGGKSVVLSGNIEHTAVNSIRNVSTNSAEKNLINDVDVFRPAFNEDKSISIKITVPGINPAPITATIQLPMSMVPGQFQ